MGAEEEATLVASFLDSAYGTPGDERVIAYGAPGEVGAERQRSFHASMPGSLLY